MDDTRRQAWVTFLVASAPAWIVAAVVALALYRLTDVPGWIAAAVVAVWITTDVVRFPRIRRYYTSKPAEQRMVGASGVALSRLSPDGFARVRGELWQVVLADPHTSLPEGAALHVREVHGLELTVEPATARDTRRTSNT